MGSVSETYIDPRLFCVSIFLTSLINFPLYEYFLGTSPPHDFSNGLSLSPSTFESFSSGGRCKK